eukprot:SAG22_NODE_17_length_32684_cov_34.234095_6_plen_73_part_00
MLPPTDSSANDPPLCTLIDATSSATSASVSTPAGCIVMPAAAALLKLSACGKPGWALTITCYPAGLAKPQKY